VSDFFSDFVSGFFSAGFDSEDVDSEDFYSDFSDFAGRLSVL
jgi:hypothetical protein